MCQLVCVCETRKKISVRWLRYCTTLLALHLKNIVYDIAPLYMCPSGVTCPNKSRIYFFSPTLYFVPLHVADDNAVFLHFFFFFCTQFFASHLLTSLLSYQPPIRSYSLLQPLYSLCHPCNVTNKHKISPHFSQKCHSVQSAELYCMTTPTPPTLLSSLAKQPNYCAVTVMCLSPAKRTHKRTHKPYHPFAKLVVNPCRPDPP